MTRPQNAINVFLSYAHEDEPLLRKLETHLSSLKRQGLISTWYDRQIVPGTNWARVIDQRLEQASIILLLVSANFLASDYCYQVEMKRAMARHQAGEAGVIPIVVRPCDWNHAPFAMLQCLPRDGKAVTAWDNRDLAWNEVIVGIRQTIEDLHQGTVPARSRQETESGSKQESSADRFSVDVCIVCALAKEARAFLEVVRQQCKGAIEERISPRYHYSYRFATIKNNKDESLNLHVSWLPRYGPQEMILHLSRILEECQPRIAIMTGICAGDAQQVQLGDLVVAERTFTYDNGKFMLDEYGRSVHELDTMTYQLDANILQFLGLFDDWKPLIARLKRPPSPAESRLKRRGVRCHIKAMASGSAVRADNPFQDVRSPVRNTVAIDMEGAAFGLVMSRHPLTPWLVVKGVCDYADQDKTDVYHDYAAHASALYALSLIQAYVTNERLPHLCGPSGQAELSEVWNVPHNKISLTRLPITDSHLFFGREKELAVLDSAWANPQTNIVSLVAWGGVGKTALVNAWLNRMQLEDYRGAQCAFDWSFYSQGAAEGKQASADLFIATALREFNDSNPNAGSPWQKGERLVELIRKQRTLLILDGLEPLQYPSSEYGHEGRLKDPGLQSLLKGLARSNPGLCVITTRLPVDDLRAFVGPTVESLDLENLSEEAGAQLLKFLEVKGTPYELKEAVQEFEGYALALNLLGRYLVTVYNGDVRQRDKIVRLTEERRQGKHARRVMESYTLWFEGKPELDILHIMGLFDRPLDWSVLQALIKEPAIEGLTSQLVGLADEDWKYALANLRQARLLAGIDRDEPDTLDCHPLVREYFGEKLEKSNPVAWREAHSRLFEYYEAQPEKYCPDTLEGMEPLFEAVIHGCHAGRHQEAFDDVYEPRIQRGDVAFSTRILGAFSTDLAALSGFFEKLWVTPIMELTDEDRGKVLTWAAFRLNALGRLEEAIKAFEAAIAIWEHLKKWDLAARDTINVSLMLQFRGDLIQALRYAQLSVKYADQIESLAQPELGRDRAVHARAQEADVLHQIGHIQESEERFREAEERQRRWPNEPRFLYSYQGFQYRNLLLALGDYQMVIDQTQKTERETIDFFGVRGRAFNLLLMGRAYLLQALLERANDLSRAEVSLENAVDVLRQAGNRDTIPDGLLARAQLHRVRGAFERAQQDLEEALSIAERDGMGLHRADAHLEYARLYLVMGEKKKGRESLALAKEMITRMSYHRRDREAVELENALSNIL